MKSVWWVVDTQIMLHPIQSELSILDPICNSANNAAKVRWSSILIKETLLDPSNSWPLRYMKIPIYKLQINNSHNWDFKK
jgi:hypothetical protein